MLKKLESSLTTVIQTTKPYQTVYFSFLISDCLSYCFNPRRNPAMDAGDDEFTITEMMEMKKLYDEKGEDAFDPEFCKPLASTFSRSSNRIGKAGITWEQVQNWLMEIHEQTQGPESCHVPLPLNVVADPRPPVNTIFPRLKGSLRPVSAKAADLSDLIYEAKSTRDNAWYDVGTFLTYRVLSTGHLEVKVRFAGFDYGHDEWVNLKTCVRERSIPLVHSECHKVRVGDLVLCYRVNPSPSLSLLSSPSMVFALNEFSTIHIDRRNMNKHCTMMLTWLRFEDRSMTLTAANAFSSCDTTLMMSRIKLGWTGSAAGRVAQDVVAAAATARAYNCLPKVSFTRQL
ncbi:Protein SAWADEE HOMEODOMAIN HOMOLOG 1 [Linum perenne]